MVLVKLHIILSAAIIFSCQASKSETRKLRLYLSYYPTIADAGIFLAQERGWYRDAGIDLKIDFKDLNIVDKVTSSHADIGMHSAHQVIQARGQGHRVKAFAANYQINPLSIAAHPRFNSLAELKGRTVAIFSDHEKDFLRVVLSSAGMKLEDISLLKISDFSVNRLVSGLRNKEFDAVTVWEFNHPIAYALKGFQTIQFPGCRHGFHFYGSVFFAKEHFIENRSDDLAEFLRVTARGWQEVYKRPSEQAHAFVQRWYPTRHYIGGSKELTKDHQLMALRLLRRYLYQGVGVASYGEMTHFHWTSSLRIAEEHMLVPRGQVRPKEVYTREVLDRKKNLQ